VDSRPSSGGASLKLTHIKREPEKLKSGLLSHRSKGDQHHRLPRLTKRLGEMGSVSHVPEISHSPPLQEKYIVAKKKELFNTLSTVCCDVQILFPTTSRGKRRRGGVGRTQAVLTPKRSSPLTRSTLPLEGKNYVDQRHKLWQLHFYSTEI